jgi:hypothetical protein
VIVVRIFFGSTSHLKIFIIGFFEIAKPLHGMTRCNKAFPWAKEHENVFEALKEKACNSLVM